jgi:hypothetical protein
VGHVARQNSHLRFVHSVIYKRHFLLLTGFAVCIGAASLAHLALDLSVAFALYGALHATAMVLSLRAPVPAWRQCAFVVIAAGLAVVAVRVGVYAGRWLIIPGTAAGLYGSFALASVMGALAYGIVATLSGYARLTPTSLAAIALACAAATAGAVFILVHAHFLGPWWLAVLWWYAFSGGLWYFDRAPRDAVRLLKGRSAT